MSSTSSAPREKSARRYLLAATILGSSMAFIDGTVVNVALPALQAAFHATAVEVQWVIESYALFLAALLLVGGSLGDHFGRRLIYSTGVVLFTLASIWCGLAPNVTHLIAARAVQGIGGALLVPGSLAIITTSFPQEERGRAIGTWSAFTSNIFPGAPFSSSTHPSRLLFLCSRSGLFPKAATSNPRANSIGSVLRLRRVVLARSSTG
jgi:MFS family permease